MFKIRCRNTILPGTFLEKDANRIASELSKSDINGWIYYVISDSDSEVQGDGE